MASVKIDSKDFNLGPEFSEDNNSGLIGISDLLDPIVNTLKDSAIGKMVTSFKVEDLLTMLKDGGVQRTTGIIIVTILCLMFTYFLFKGETEIEPEKVEEEVEKVVLRDYTVEQLRDFDGKGTQPIYIALKGDVFDVSSAKEFYGEGSGYNCFAGREATRAMAKLSFEEEDLSNSSVEDLGPFERGNLDDWYSKFKDYKCYPIIGRISTPQVFRDYNSEDLQATKDNSVIPVGRIDAPILMGICGQVIDVSYGGTEMYGKDGPYYLFSGIDASKALAKMSFKPEDLNNKDLTDLTEVQQKTLRDWEKKFIVSRKYPIVGKLV
jgi:membrane-associated progesterone receptor component